MPNSDNINIVVLVIILLFSTTYMTWMHTDKSKQPNDFQTNIKNIHIEIPLRYYPESHIQLNSIIMTSRFIYHILALFLLGTKKYHSQSFTQHIKQQITCTYLNKNMTLLLIIKKFNDNHINDIKSALKNTITVFLLNSENTSHNKNKIPTKLTKLQSLFTAYISVFNTLYNICHNKSDYDKCAIYSYLAARCNMPPVYLPAISNMLKLDCKTRNVYYNIKRGMILYYPMTRNIMTNHKGDSHRVRSRYINMLLFTPDCNYDSHLETQLKKYNTHCYHLITESFKDYYYWYNSYVYDDNHNTDNNQNINDVFL